MTAAPGAGYANNSGYRGAAWTFSGGSGWNALDFLIRQVMAGKAFAGLVQVQAVHGGGLTSPSLVDVQPLVDQVDGWGNRTAHGVVYGLPCFRLQSGLGAVVLDPVVGDIGQAIICDRDISSVKATRGRSAPGSSRKNAWSDGCYYGSFLGQAPTTYVRINQDGMEITTPGTITMNAAQLTINADVSTFGALTNDSVNVGSTHIHDGVVVGGGDHRTAGIAMASTLLLDRTLWDLVLDASGNIALAMDPYSAEQDVASACRTFLGECWYDTALGIPFFTAILGQAPPIALVKQYFVDAALAVPGVANAQMFVAGLVDRELTGQVQFVDTNGANGTVQVSGTLT